MTFRGPFRTSAELSMYSFMRISEREKEDKSYRNTEIGKFALLELMKDLLRFEVKGVKDVTPKYANSLSTRRMNLETDDFLLEATTHSEGVEIEVKEKESGILIATAGKIRIFDLAPISFDGKKKETVRDFPKELVEENIKNAIDGISNTYLLLMNPTSYVCKYLLKVLNAYQEIVNELKEQEKLQRKQVEWSMIEQKYKEKIEENK